MQDEHLFAFQPYGGSVVWLYYKIVQFLRFLGFLGFFKFFASFLLQVSANMDLGIRVLEY